jgi:hypothetical protein
MTSNYRKFVFILLAAVLCASLTFSVKGSGKSRIKILDTEMKMNSKVNSFLKSLPTMAEEAFEESSLPSLSITSMVQNIKVYIMTAAIWVFMLMSELFLHSR